MKAQKGFTLVEILIVVVILGILAAIVIPQFTNASSEAANSSVKADLQTLRSQVELYKVQHGDDLPGMSGGSFDEDLFETHMTTRTDKNGDAYTTSSDTGPFGPYMQQIPTNAVTGLDTINAGSGTTAGGTEDYGWALDTDTGQFYAENDPNL